MRYIVGKWDFTEEQDQLLSGRGKEDQAMFIDADVIIKAAAVLAALSVIVGVISADHRI